MDDPSAMGWALLHLGLVAEKRGDDDRAAGLYEESLAIFRAGDDPVGTAALLVNLGDTAYRRRDLPRSALVSDEALALATEVGDRVWATMALCNLGQLALARGDLAAARGHYGEALTLARQMGDRWYTADALVGLAGAAVLAGLPIPAVRWLSAVRACCDALGTPSVPHHRQFAEALAAVQTGPTFAAFAESWPAGQALGLDQAVAEALDPALWQAPVPRPRGPLGADVGGAHLTDRELDVLRLLVAGHSDRAIAEALFISRRTAERHVGSILDKLGVTSRTAAAAVAITRGLVPATTAPAG